MPSRFSRLFKDLACPDYAARYVAECSLRKRTHAKKKKNAGGCRRFRVAARGDRCGEWCARYQVSPRVRSAKRARIRQVAFFVSVT